jgi:hypothetical protein
MLSLVKTLLQVALIENVYPCSCRVEALFVSFIRGNSFCRVGFRKASEAYVEAKVHLIR